MKYFYVFSKLDEQRDMELHRDTTPSPQDSSPVFELPEQDAKQEENIKNTSSIQIIQNEHEVDNKQVLYFFTRK